MRPLVRWLLLCVAAAVGAQLAILELLPNPNPNPIRDPNPNPAARMPLPPVLLPHAEALQAAGAEALASELCALGQEHLFAAWPPAGERSADKARLLGQLQLLDAQYPGGLAAYVGNARRLLGDSARGVNPFEGFAPRVPEGERVDPADAALEREGVREAADAAFVLVAGGLGERLGYHGIKVALPAETSTGLCFLELYCRRILALQGRARAAGRADAVLPLAIMTSGDTHDATVALLERHANFGMADGQITLVRQEKVPCLDDADGRLAVDAAADPFEVLTKPHGHGDVHTLLHQAGLARRWADEGRRWVLFFQDTNALVFHAVPAALAVSARRSFDVNSLTVARRPGEAVGAICRLEREDGSGLTVNVEYNQLDPLLRGTVSPDGDVADPETGFSPYPGNCNVLVMAAGTYAATLERTGGAVPEFVNPKYRDETKTAFLKPTRLECMMQDYPRLLGADARVGFTQCERWMSFSAVKNNLATAKAKQAATGFADGAAAGEAAIYSYFRRVLASAPGVEVAAADPPMVVHGGVPTEDGARIVVLPSAGVTWEEVAGKFGGADGGAVRVSARSTLVVEGEGVRVRSLDLDGALVIRAVPGANVTVEGLAVQNDGWVFVPVDPENEAEDETNRIRGYRLEKRATRELVFDAPGDYTVSE